MSDFQLPPPADWQKFERMCLDIFQAKYVNDHVISLGRPGQDQFGLDIIINTNSGKTIGIQCKQFSITGKGRITKQKIIDEYKKLSKININIDEYIFATTNPADSKLQIECIDYISSISSLSDTTIPPLTIYFWDKIQSLLFSSPNIIRLHYSQFYISILYSDRDEIIKLLRLDSRLFSIPIGMEKESSFDDKISQISRLIERGHVYAGLEELDTINSLDSNIDNTLSMKICAIRAFAFISLNSPALAIEQFQNAFNLEPQTLLGEIYNGFSIYLIGNREAANYLAIKCMKVDPTNRLASLLYVLTIPDSADLDIVISNIHADLLADSDICDAISELSRRRGDFIKSLYYSEASIRADPGSWRAQMERAISLVYEDITLSNSSFRLLKIDEKQADKVTSSLDLMHKSWSYIKNRDVARRYISFCANYVTLLSMCGEDGYALGVIAEGLELQPNYIPLLKHRIRIMMSRHSFVDAKNDIHRIETELDLETTLQLATCEINIGNNQEAINYANIVFQNAISPVMQKDAIAILITGRFRQSRDHDYLFSCLDQYPVSVKLLMTLFRMLKESNFRGDYTRLTTAIQGFLSDTPNDVDPKELSELYFHTGDKDRSLDILLPHYDYAFFREENSLVMQLLLESKKIVKAQSMLDNTDPRQHTLDFYVLSRCKIMLMQSDIVECISYIKSVEFDISKKIFNEVMLNSLGLMSDKNPLVEFVLNMESDDITKSDIVFTAVHEMVNAKHFDKAVAVAYRMLKYDFMNPIKQMFYINILDLVVSKGWVYPIYEKFELDSTILCHDSRGKNFVRTKTIDKDPSVQLHEINEHSLVSKAIGDKRSGDSFTLNMSSFHDEPISILTITSKYKYVYNLIYENHINIFGHESKIYISSLREKHTIRMNIREGMKIAALRLSKAVR